MNIIYRAACRTVQWGFRRALPVLPYRTPQILDRLDDVPELLRTLGIRSVLLVTDRGIRTNGLSVGLEEQIRDAGINLAVYDETKANPTIRNAEEAKAMYLAEDCQGIIALGGGSSMDCAKAAGALIVYPKKTAKQLGGLLKVWRKLPPLIAVPTTAGTGSEVTVTAVMTDSENKHKYTMNSFPLIPHYAVLDPAVTVSLPAHLTASTGMDALTHAVEAYIGGSTTKETRALSLEAARLIFTYLPRAYADGKDLEARRMMLDAAYKAGIAFSKSYVGYIHAVAHSLGGQYNIPHGLANAVLMPAVLEAYGSSVYKKLSEMAVYAGIADESDSDFAAAHKFISAVRRMNEQMNIPNRFPEIRNEDIPAMAHHAAREANPLYPVPRLMDERELCRLYELVSMDRRITAASQSTISRKDMVYGH